MDLQTRMQSNVTQVRDWFQRFAPACYETLSQKEPASGEDIARLEQALGRALPEDFKAFLSCTDGGLSFWEYDGLGVQGILHAMEWRTRLLQEGRYEGHEIFPDDQGRLQRVKWNPRWMPFAEDSCANAFCLDLDPGPQGKLGQVFSWETRGGAGISTSRPRSFLEYLEFYRAQLLSGQHRYDVDSGTFDGPYVQGGRP